MYNIKMIIESETAKLEALAQKYENGLAWEAGVCSGLKYGVQSLHYLKDAIEDIERIASKQAREQPE